MQVLDTEWPIDGSPPAFLRKNHATTAILNRWEALSLISRTECISQRQLARTTGLRTSTMSNIIRDLTELKLVRESGPLATNRAGPKENGLEMEPHATWAAGLQLDPQGHKLGLVDAAGNLMTLHHFTPRLPWRDAVAQTPSVIAQLVKSTGVHPAKRAGVGVSIAGIIDAARGKVLFSRPLEMRNENMISTIEALDVGPACIERDVNCGAYIEHQRGAARKMRTFIYYLIRPGFGEVYQFGLGLVLNGRIFHGLSSAAGELDRLLAPEFSPTETRPSAYDRFYRDCGVRLASIINLLDVSFIVMAGGDPQFTDKRLQSLREQVNELALPVPDRKIQIERTEVDETGILRGAALLAVNRHLRGILFAKAQGSKRTLRK